MHKTTAVGLIRNKGISRLDVILFVWSEFFKWY